MSRFSEGELDGILGEALAAERQVPAEWREAARAAYSWRSVDQELLELTYDSLLEAGASVRGDGGRTLEFTADGLTLEVELTEGRIMGQLAHPVGGEVTVERADGQTLTTATDESGFFTVADEGSGPVRFAVRVGESRLVTEWVVL
jgi:hypothetical protein